MFVVMAEGTWDLLLVHLILLKILSAPVQSCCDKLSLLTVRNVQRGSTKKGPFTSKTMDIHIKA